MINIRVIAAVEIVITPSFKIRFSMLKINFQYPRSYVIILDCEKGDYYWK